jgi:hypothetical protein
MVAASDNPGTPQSAIGEVLAAEQEALAEIGPKTSAAGHTLKRDKEAIVPIRTVSRDPAGLPGPVDSS